MGKISWTYEETEFLKNNYNNNKTVREISSFLNKTEKAVKTKANRLGFFKKSRLSEEDCYKLSKLFNGKYLGPFPHYSHKRTNWRCECGCDFSRSYNNIHQRLAKGFKVKCVKCSFEHRASLNRLTQKDYEMVAENLDCKFMGPLPRNQNCKTYWTCCCGDQFYRTFEGVFRRKQNKCLKCSPRGGRKGINSGRFTGYGEITGAYIAQIKEKAKSRNLFYKVSLEYLWDLFLYQNKKCALTDLDITFAFQSDGFKGTASLDRIDSLKGYIEGNVQWVHKDINIMKFDFTQEEYIKMCCLVADKYRMGERSILHSI
jgi:hypothetical protein